MTDQVDTDALRRDARILAPGFPGVERRLSSAADEVDRLRESNEEAESARSAAAAYGDQLRAVIENAPHDTGCATPAEQLLGIPRDPARACTCWKAEAL